MKLQEIFDALSAGEFSQLSVGGQPAGVLSEANYPEVLTHVNAALTALYTRFNLKEGSLKLQLVGGKTKYSLASAFAVNGKKSVEPVRYIIDTVAEPFTDDILKVLRVSNDAGEALPLNDRGDPNSVLTLTDTVLQVPALLPTEFLTVSYKASHKVLATGLAYFDPARVNVELPRTHMEALLFYVASRVHNPVGMVNELNFGNTYFMKYENACLMLEGKGMQVDQGTTSDRLHRNGWV